MNIVHETCFQNRALTLKISSLDFSSLWEKSQLIVEKLKWAHMLFVVPLTDDIKMAVTCCS